MEQKVLSSMDGVSIYGIISILIFAAFFTGTLIWVFRLKKNYLNHMAGLPLDSGEKKSTDKIQSSKHMSNDPKEPLLLDHNYDGIQELDNNLPRWWVWLFYITIIFSAVYLLFYHVLRIGDLQAAEYNQEMKAGDTVKGAAMTKFEAGIPALTPSADPAVLESGRLTYGKYCAPCHRVDGGGLVGPNLTDNYWIHGSSFADSVKIIWDGVPAKGMITWKTVLKPEEIYAVASYIYTLRGAKLATPGKLPENQQPVKPAGPSQFE